MQRVDIVVLAGDRGPDDPLARQAGVPGKALVPVAGRSMLERVLATLQAWPRRGRVILVAPEHPDYRAAAVAAGFVAADDASDGSDSGLVWVAPAASLVDSVRAGLAACSSEPSLLLTADHALLDAAWLDELLAAVERQPATAVFVGVADWAAVMARFPGSRRTRYRFSDISICGTNLFALRRAGSERLLEVWRQVEQQRKRPWRIVALLGLGNLASYLAGRLSRQAAFAGLSARIGVPIQAVDMRDPLTAVDVDSLSDLALVDGVLSEREGRRC